MADREARLAAKREWYWLNREEILEQRRARYKADPEYRARVLAGTNAYKAANPEKARAAVRRWHDENRDYLQAYKRKWRQKNPDKAKTSARLDQLRRRSGVTEDGREFGPILLFDPCSYCGAPAEHVDHIVSVAAGGDGDWLNLAAACGPCNRRKQKRSLLHFLLAERTA